jgi:hypothetical protein
MICLVQVSASVYEVAATQPATYKECIHVLATSSDLAINAWALTASQGFQIAIAIGVCWATGFAFRAIGQFLKSSSNESE